MKLIDRLLADGSVRVDDIRPDVDHSVRRRLGYFRVEVRRPPAVVIADDVVPYVCTTSEFGCLRCPVDGMWIEGQGFPSSEQYSSVQIGGYITERPADPSTWPDLPRGEDLYQLEGEFFAWMRPNPPIPMRYVATALVDANGGFITIGFSPAHESIRHVTDTQIRRIESAVANGTFESDFNAYLEAFTAGHEDPDFPFFAVDLKNALYASKWLFRAVGLMNVKGVQLDDVPRPDRWIKAHRRRTGVEPVEKLTRIRLPRSSGPSSTSSEPTRDLLPEHGVRGHPRFYTSERPLFGRPGAAGWIWVPEHKRGNPARGTRRHEYQLKPPPNGDE